MVSLGLLSLSNALLQLRAQYIPHGVATAGVAAFLN